ncbi:type VII toxin-antitoxin system MntA family adenylyltransferase antitoxin [Virgibacillus dakarensis]|uniref:type VII toxin-antitoxin system MntA family adenylyltransferase antitoxin n=1 Tax=Virgibacillus dakarensis TaxID=1917889 RepID=UPI002E124CFF
MEVIGVCKEITYAENGADNMLSKQEILDELSKSLNTWREEYDVKRIGLFGSYSRDKQNEFSDIDVAVEFNDADLSFDNYMNLKICLEDLFQKPIDLVILNDIKPALKSNILSTITFVNDEYQ